MPYLPVSQVVSSLHIYDKFLDISLHFHAHHMDHPFFFFFMVIVYSVKNINYRALKCEFSPVYNLLVCLLSNYFPQNPLLKHFQSMLSSQHEMKFHTHIKLVKLHFTQHISIFRVLGGWRIDSKLNGNNLSYICCLLIQWVILLHYW
jgi:hypothetical protein